MSTTREHVAELLALGLSRRAIAERLGIAPSTVTYHVRRRGGVVDQRFARRHDWAEVQAFHDAGHGVLECLERFGMARQAWYDAVGRGELVARSSVLPIEEVLTGSRHRAHVKRRLLAAGLLPEHCAVCGIAEWRGAPLVLQLHHVNGVGDDNRLANLQLLCPNCHSQTANWGGRNKGRAGVGGVVATT